jgi:hypothetical protein
MKALYDENELKVVLLAARVDCIIYRGDVLEFTERL